MSKLSKIFISYRRADSNVVTGRIYDRLVAAYGAESVFKDVDAIPFGEDFRTHIKEHVEQCQVLVAVIGKAWLSITDDAGHRRLDDPNDWVCLEIAAALQRKIPVVPLLVMGAEMPKAQQLPAILEDLAYRNGLEIRSDPDFHGDMDRLIKRINVPRIPDSASVSGASTPNIEKLSAPQRKQFRQALMSAFPDLDSFSLMFEDQFGKPLNQVVNINNFYEKVVADTIKWVESEGKLSDLIQAAVTAKPNSHDLQVFVNSLSGNN